MSVLGLHDQSRFSARLKIASRSVLPSFPKPVDHTQDENGEGNEADYELTALNPFVEHDVELVLSDQLYDRQGDGDQTSVEHEGEPEYKPVVDSDDTLCVCICKCNKLSWVRVRSLHVKGLRLRVVVGIDSEVH